MAITVTASQGGTGTFNGIALTVKVLLNAAATQNGATFSDTSTLTTPQHAITPNATGSWVYGAVYNDAAATAYTPNGSTTFSQNVTFAGDGCTFGTFRTTGTTTSGTPVTVGASAPTEPTGTLSFALAEVLVMAGQSLAEDASSPAGANTTAATTVTTASFTPPGGSLLVAMVSNNYAGTGTLTMTVSDTSGLSWSQAIGETIDSASVWLARVPPVPNKARALNTQSVMRAALW